MSGRVLQVDLTKFFILSGNLVVVPCPAAVTTVIDFVGRFNGLAKSLLIDNRDAANAITYRLHGRSADPATIRLNSSRALSVPCEWLEINAGAAGVTEVTAEVIPLSVLGMR